MSGFDFGKASKAAVLSFAIAANGAAALAPTAAMAQDKERTATAVFGSLYSDADMEDVASYGSRIGCSVETRRGVLPGGIRLAAPVAKVGVAATVEQAGSWLERNC